ncbi:MAG: glycosyl hydrolase [bacterium]
MGRETIISEFGEPRVEFRPAPFWFWNYALEDSEIKWQIREMHEKGMGGFFIHARHGLKTPYMSEEWLKRIECAVEEAAKLKMRAWLYDEDNWPSGTAGGLITSENPSFRMSALCVGQQFDVESPRTVKENIKTDGLLAVLAVPMEEGKLRNVPEGTRDITSQVKKGVLTWRVPKGAWKVIALVRRVFPGHFVDGYVDTLNPTAIRRFIEVTHKVYVGRLGKYIPKVVPGIFTDEPSAYYSRIPENRGIPWTDSLEDRFNASHDYTLRGGLPALFFDAGENTTRIRCDFYSFVTQMYVNAFYKQIFNYCNSVGLAFVGHVNSEGELFQQVKQHGDFFRVSEYMHYGGVDHLFEETWPDKRFPTNNLVGPKFASSAAHLLGKPAVLSEAFGVAGQWRISLRTLKWLADWQIALGVNLFCQHAFYYSIKGFRKTECPPGEFYQSPFWPYYRTFSDYLARLCNLFSGGRHVAQAAILYPNRSMWASMDPGKSPQAEQIEDAFSKISELLLRCHCDFDYISEEILQRAKFDGGKIKVLDGDGCTIESYELLILPNCTILAEKSIRTITNFFRKGGKILAVNRLPNADSQWTAESSGEGGSPVISKFEKIYGKGIYSHLVSYSDQVIWNKSSSAVVVRNADEAMIEGVLDRLLERRDVRILLAEGEAENPEGRPVSDIIHLHYIKGGRHFYFFANTSRERSYKAEILLRESGTLEYWNPLNGEISPFYNYYETGGGICAKLEFAPTQSHVLALDPKGKPSEMPLIQDGDVKVEEIGPDGKRSFRVSAYARGEGTSKFHVTVVFKGEQKRLEARRTRQLPPIVLDQEWRFMTAKPNALPLREWKYKQSMGPHFHDFYRAVCVYETTIPVEVIPKSARLLIDGTILDKIWRGRIDPDVTITVNGKTALALSASESGEMTLRGLDQSEYLDHYAREVDITGLLKVGSNRIAVISANDGGMYETNPLSEPLYLIGRFSLRERGNRWAVARERELLHVGSWTDQGYPYYSGLATYEKKFSLDREYLRCKLILNIPSVRDLADVRINGREVAVMPWEPFWVDITKFVREGENILTINVANSLDNLFSENRSPSGILEPPEIVPYNKLEWKI